MKTFGKWVLDHLRMVVAIAVFGITFIVIGAVILGSYASYKKYEKVFNANDLEVRSLMGAQPKYIEINDSFKSEYKNRKTLEAEALSVTTTQQEYLIDDYIDLTEKGGSVSAKLSLEEKSFVDIDFEIASENSYQVDGKDKVGVEDLLTNVQFIVNGETMEEVINLEEDWHHLVMVGFALPAGDVTVEIKSTSGKNALMPQLRNITFYSSQLLFDAE